MENAGNAWVKKLPVICAGSLLFFVLGRFVAIPSPVDNTNISIQYGVLAFVAAFYGPAAGALTGLVGHTLIDISAGWGIWWSWVIGSAVFGAIMGAGAEKFGIRNGAMESREITGFNVIQAGAHIIAWCLAAPVLDILIYREPAGKVFMQGLVGGISNIITTAIIGTLLCIGYSAFKPGKAH